MRCALLLLFAGTLAAQEPDALSCRAVRAEPAGETSLLVEVEVQNRSARFAEPRTFVVRIGEEEHRVRRFPLPDVGRRGRAVAPAGEQRYWLQIATGLRPRGRRGTRVEVVDAVFHDGPVLEEAPVTISGIEHRDMEEAGYRFDASVLRLDNALDRPVDVLLLAQCEEPARGRWLFPVRVAPGEGGAVTIHEAASALDWEGRVGRVFGVRIRRAEVVDWTAVYDVPEAPVLDRFAAAWNAWHRWDTPPVGWGGRFVLRTETTDGGETKRQLRRGRFTIAAGGEPVATVEEVSGTEDRRPPVSVFALMFRDLRRPSVEELQKDPGLVPLDAARVQLPRGGSRDEYGDTFEVGEDGRIVASTAADSVDRYRWKWTAEPLGDGYVVTGREEWQEALGTTVRERRAYVVLQSGVVFPRSLERVQTYGALRTVYELVLDDLAPGTDVDVGLPAGAAADAVRAAWEGVYAYPEARTDLVAELEVKHPGTDGVWAGVRKVRGTLTLRGFRGFAMHGGGWEECTFAAEGRGLTPDAKAALENAVDDRLRLWAGRDLAGRAPFDETFRGAEIREEAPGRFVVEGCGVTRVVIADGVPRQVEFAFGRRSEFTWRKVADAIVPVEIRSGDEVLTARFREVADGLVVPVELRFEDVFGPDWGPETLVFSDIRVGSR